MTSTKPPKREHACPECGKLCVNAHAVRVHRLWKHGTAGQPTAPPKPPDEPPKTDKKEDDWWL